MRNPGQKGRARKGQNRVLRGGSWINNGRNLRSAQRNGNTPGNRNQNIGLRLAGASRAGGSMNQRPVLFRSSVPMAGRSPGPRCVSRCRADALPTQSPPAGRLLFRGAK